MTVQEVWQKIKEIFEPLVERAIKEVESWDGSASNYPDTDSYCAACLIDVNSAAGKDTKTQDHCMLPVREAGDSASTYVKQAVYAAAGGRGITRVVRPDDVPENAWESAVKAAANKIIDAYGQMDEQAPDSVYEVAGKEPPSRSKRQSENLSERVEDVRVAIQAMLNTSQAMENSVSYWVSQVYTDYAIVEYRSEEGVKYYRVPYLIDGDGKVVVMPKENWQEGTMEFIGSERAASMQTIYSQVMNSMEAAGLYPMDVFHDGEVMFAIGTRDGKLFKLPMTVSVDGAVQLGEPVQVMVDFPATESRGALSVVRQDDGRYRWTAVSCTAILNRDGELDTTRLFDKFIERSKEKMPEVDFFHVQGTDMGVTDYLARDGFTLLASGLFDDTEIGRAAAEGLAADPGYWGTSIMYKPLGRELVNIAGVDIPAYVDGVLEKITILPERYAAALFTTMEVEMNDRIKDALRKLLGDALADEMEKRVDGINQRVASESMVARESESPAATETPTTQGEPPVEQDPATTPAIEAEAIATMRAEQADIKAKLSEALEAITKLVEVFEPRLAALERSDEDRKRAWLGDLPERKILPQAQIWRPRESAVDNGEPEPAAAQAARIMESKKNK